MYPQEFRERVAAAFISSEKTLEMVANEFGVSPPTVRKCVIEAGHEIPPRKGRPRLSQEEKNRRKWERNRKRLEMRRKAHKDRCGYLLSTGMKECRKCKKVKPVMEFGVDAWQKDGLNKKCFECRSDDAKRLREKTPYYHAGLYGVTPEQLTRIFDHQGRRCAICRSDESRHNSGKWPTDHCRRTGLLRGFLCNRCNTYLGSAENNTVLMSPAMWAYVDNPPAKQIGVVGMYRRFKAAQASA